MLRKYAVLLRKKWLFTLIFLLNAHQQTGLNPCFCAIAGLHSSPSFCCIFLQIDYTSAGKNEFFLCICHGRSIRLSFFSSYNSKMIVVKTITLCHCKNSTHHKCNSEEESCKQGTFLQNMMRSCSKKSPTNKSK